nr:cytochrome c oxidase subunit NDUFA4-like [Saimiri boliviensis boliviensis]
MKVVQVWARKKRIAIAEYLEQQKNKGIKFTGEKRRYQGEETEGGIQKGYKTYFTIPQKYISFMTKADAANLLLQIIVQAKKHLTLIPLFLFIRAGGIGAALYLLHLALFNPDVCWGRKNNPEPWNKLCPNDKYKFYSVNVDYNKLKKEHLDF